MIRWSWVRRLALGSRYLVMTCSAPGSAASKTSSRCGLSSGEEGEHPELPPGVPFGLGRPHSDAAALPVDVLPAEGEVLAGAPEAAVAGQREQEPPLGIGAGGEHLLGIGAGNEGHAVAVGLPARLDLREGVLGQHPPLDALAEDLARGLDPLGHGCVREALLPHGLAEVLRLRGPTGCPKRLLPGEVGCRAHRVHPGRPCPPAGAVRLFRRRPIALASFRTPAETLAVAGAKGVWDAVFILLVIWPALLLHEVMDRAGGYEALRHGITRLSRNELFVVVALGWVFASFLRGMRASAHRSPSLLHCWSRWACARCTRW